MGQRALSGTSCRSEKPVFESSYLLAGWLGIGQRAGGIAAEQEPTLLVRHADQHEGPAWFEELMDGLGDDVTLHPMERLGERGVAERSEAGRQLFGPSRDPLRVSKPTLGGKASRFTQHVLIGVDADHLGEQVSQEQ